jgi:hypothetical protein
MLRCSNAQNAYLKQLIIKENGHFRPISTWDFGAGEGAIAGRVPAEIARLAVGGGLLRRINNVAVGSFAA